MLTKMITKLTFFFQNVGALGEKSPQYLKDAFMQQCQTLKSWLADDY